MIKNRNAVKASPWFRGSGKYSKGWICQVALILLLAMPDTATSQSLLVPPMLEAGQWRAVSNKGVFAEIGTSTTGKIVMILLPNSSEFQLVVGSQDLNATPNAKFKITFSSGTQLQFVGELITQNSHVLPHVLASSLPNNLLAQWTHEFTAGSFMTISFAGDIGSQVTFDLRGTTPTVLALSHAIANAGITDLPAPWGNGQSQNSVVQEEQGQLSGATSSANLLPIYNVDQQCGRVAAGTDPRELVFQQCVQMEQGSYDELQSEWSQIPPDIQETCLRSGNKEEPENYTRMVNCVDQLLPVRSLQEQGPFDPNK